MCNLLTSLEHISDIGMSAKTCPSIRTGRKENVIVSGPQTSTKLWLNSTEKYGLKIQIFSDR